jgi:S1-C subfamily serine protease
MVAAGTAGAVLAGAGVVAFGLGERVIDRAVVERVALDPMSTSLGAGAAAVEGVRQRVAPAVVAVGVAATGSDARGSGVVVRDDGIVITSSRLVDDLPAVAVTLPDGSSVDGEVVGADELTGLAVLDLAGEGYTTAVLSTASGLALGTSSFAVGAGLAGGTSTTAGVIGATKRYRAAWGATLEGVIEVTGDAPAEALGGPLVDERGAVVGIVIAVDAGTRSYVAPIEVARKVSGDLLATGWVRHCWLGIEGSDAPPAVASALGAAPSTTAGTAGSTGSAGTAGGTGGTATTAAATGTTEPASGTTGGGVVIASIVPGGPADRSGLRVGDVLVALDGDPIAHMPDLVRALRSRSPGDRVDTTVERDGGRTTLVVTLGEQPDAGS